MRTVRGQIIHLYRDMNSAKYHEDTTVSISPPKKPSQVFFGDSLMSGVRPKKKPASLTAFALPKDTDNRKVHSARASSFASICTITARMHEMFTTLNFDTAHRQAGHM